jgi:uncharacterized membrane protein YozB (DUF420 family)
MPSLLGTRASLQADINLILQSVIFLLLILGVLFARRRDIASHGRVMRIVAFLNLVSISVVMAPSLFINLFPLLTFYPTLGATTLTHAIIGGCGSALGTTWAFRKFRSVRPWMMATMVLWLAGFSFGIANYILGYVL